MNAPPSRSIRSGWPAPRPPRLVRVEQHEERAVGQQAARDRQVQLAAPPPRRARARRPGRRPTSRCSGRRRRPRRARAPAGSPARRDRRARPRTAPPRPRGSCRGRASTTLAHRLADRRPARLARREHRRPCSRSHAASSAAWVLLPDRRHLQRSRTSRPNLRPRCGRSSQAVQASSARISSTRWSRAATR